MLYPYLLMAILYLSLALLTALGSALTSLQMLPWFNGLHWLRAHLITLGTLTEVSFGLLPGLAAARAGQPRPALRWDIWLALNAGLITLLIGIPLVNATLIVVGGTLIFVATLLLIWQVRALHPPRPTTDAHGGRPFYLAGLTYLLLGILVGAGLWLGWSGPLRIAAPKDVHVHANLWGFTALLFAGLLIDLYPRFAGRELAWPQSITPIFWLLTAGALGLVLGAWVDMQLLAVVGLALHTGATIWLLLNVVRPLKGERQAWTPGMLHLVTSYIWLLGPVLLAPLIVLRAPGFPVGEVAGSGAPMLIYGWMLQFGYALLPYLFRRAFLPDAPAQLGGTWFSLITAHLGGGFLWAGLFSGQAQPFLYGTAFALWVLSMLPIVADLWRIVRAGLIRIEPPSGTSLV